MGHGAPAVTTQQDSCIKSDPNLRATETMGTPDYSHQLSHRDVTVRMETMKIVGGLPKIETPVKSSQ